MLLAAAPLAVMLRMPERAIPALLAGLLPGTALLSLFGTMGAAIVVGARRAGMLLPLLVLPLVTPVLIFGVAAADAAATGLSPQTASAVAGGAADGRTAAVSAGRRRGFARVRRNSSAPASHRLTCVHATTIQQRTDTAAADSVAGKRNNHVNVARHYRWPGVIFLT